MTVETSALVPMTEANQNFSKVTRLVDEAGLADCKIIVSNSLDEHTISSLNTQKACIDSYGVGERLITGATSDYSDDTLALLGAVYKIAAVEENGVFTPRIKISGTVEKITNPGLKKVYRIYDQNGKAKADLIAKADEEIDMSTPFRFVDPNMPWRNLRFTGCTANLLRKRSAIVPCLFCPRAKRAKITTALKTY